MVPPTSNKISCSNEICRYVMDVRPYRSSNHLLFQVCTVSIYALPTIVYPVSAFLFCFNLYLITLMYLRIIVIIIIILRIYFFLLYFLEGRHCGTLKTICSIALHKKVRFFMHLIYSWRIVQNITHHILYKINWT